MTDLDDELKQAVEEGEAAQAVDTSESESTGEASSNEANAPRRSLGLLAALLVMGGAILALLFSGVDDSAIYAVDTDKLVAQKEKFKDRNVRVEGVLVKGSLKRRDSPCEYRFKIEKNKVELPVRYEQCVVPDTFRDVANMDVQVTAEGRLSEAGHFQASAIMAKCPSKYEMKQRKQAGEKAPHGAVEPGGSTLSSNQFDG